MKIVNGTQNAKNGRFITKSSAAGFPKGYAEKSASPVPPRGTNGYVVTTIGLNLFQSEAGIWLFERTLKWRPIQLGTRRPA